MLLACVIMNMVYLNSETRVRLAEPGINDPSTKLVVTMATFAILYLLQENDILDPSESMLKARPIWPTDRGPSS